MSRIGIDLGGTKTEAIALDAAGGEVFRKRVPTPRGDYAATLATSRPWSTKRARARSASASPARCRRRGLATNPNSTWLIGKPLKRDHERVLGREVRVANDANCFALRKRPTARPRAPKPSSASSSAPEWAAALGWSAASSRAPTRWPANEASTPCRCPRGTTYPFAPASAAAPVRQPYLSGPALERDSGEAALDTYCERLARAFAGGIDILDPDVIVSGGSVSNVRACTSRCQNSGRVTSSPTA